MTRYACLVPLLTLAGCQQVMETPEATKDDPVLVYVSAKAIQCEYGGHTTDDTAKVLEDAGITVSASQCAVLTEVMYPAVCGGGSGSINVHTIGSSNLEKAVDLGYAPVSSLKTAQSKGYAKQDCSGRGGERKDSSL